jgi:GNAT superfamily N-acetyltransferase
MHRALPPTEDAPVNDLLVKLWTLPAPDPPTGPCVLRRALPPERDLVTDWVRRHFTPGWAAEAGVALSQTPARCLVALSVPEGALLGFACFNTTFPGFLGPIGVAPASRGQGVGDALALHALHAMRAEGHAYAIVGATRATAYYQARFGGIPIPDSWPGAYAGMLRSRDPEAG